MFDAKHLNGLAGNAAEDDWRPHQYCVPLGISDPIETIEDVLRDAELGVTEAQVKAAGHYHCMTNYGEAYRWFLAAASKGDVSAQVNLAFMHHNGQGTSLDPVAAAEWMKTAALQGDPTSQYILGLWLCEGRGMSRNELLASAWFRKAADQGHTLALKRLGAADS